MSNIVKYAIQELKINGGFIEHYEDVIKGYIVSKCFLLEEHKIFLGTTDTVHKYIVCFPYNNFEDFATWYDCHQNYKYYHEGRNYQKYIVPNYYDTYEEAKEAKDYQNSLLKGNILIDTSYAGYQKYLTEFNKTMLTCDEYEKFIYENTKELEIVKDYPPKVKTLSK